MKKIKPCENPAEYYDLHLIIYPDKTVKFIKEMDTVKIAQNKCAYDLARNVTKYLNGWKPAIVDNKEVAAITGFKIIPADLFDNYKKGYDPEKSIIRPEYEGGINNFRKKIVQNVDIRKFKIIDDFKLTVSFIIEKNGEVTNIELDQSSGFKEFDDMILNSISRIKNKWTPGNISGLPIRYRISVPLNIKAPH